MRISRWYLTALWQEETNEFQCYQGRFSGEQTPVAKYVADRVLTLPVYADLAMEDVDRICGLLKEIK